MSELKATPGGLNFSCPEEKALCNWAWIIFDSNEVPKEARQEFLDRFLAFKAAFYRSARGEQP